MKENKDKLLHESTEWILQDPRYVRWRDGHDVGLLWIHGGAGKGKTMMSIGLVEELSLRARDTIAVTYFFCQHTDYELNTVDAIIKGLILRSMSQRKEVRVPLCDRWDATHAQFNEDVHSWRELWNIFTEMLEYCTCTETYIVVDALDECRDDGMVGLLKLIVGVGLSQPSRVKWLLTSPPLDRAERELLAGYDQTLVSLELNV